jgi:hypothetical protein
MDESSDDHGGDIDLSSWVLQVRAPANKIVGILFVDIERNAIGRCADPCKL